jgi:hypothetical protein
VLNTGEDEDNPAKRGTDGHISADLQEERLKKRIPMVSGNLILLFLAFLSQDCLAGVVIEQVIKDREGRPSRVVLYFSEDQFRTDHPESGQTTIVDFKGDRIVQVDHPSKSYVDVEFSQWEKEITQRLKKSTPEVKPKARKITVRKTGETATISGFRTVKVEVLADEKLIEENWMTRDVEMKDVERVMEKVATEFSKEFKSEMKEGREIYRKLKPYGFPILVKDYTMSYGLGAIEALEVKRFENRDLSEEIFSAPKGYKRIFPEPMRK